jgi:TonB family protein
MKKFIFGVLGLFLLSVIYTPETRAQESTPKMIEGGVLNGKAISLPKPDYPEDAKKDGAHGPVTVTVTIDEEGNVIEAKAASEYKVAGTVNENGEPEMKPIHPALREAAESAARAAKFTPVKLSGQPVKVIGMIVYAFVAPGTRENGVNQISGGVLNGKALSLPQPAYPVTALDARVSGAVSVQVVIDEGGNVISATAVSGHALLKAAAAEAAKQAQFAPTLLSGKPVMVSGILTYHFEAPKEDDK